LEREAGAPAILVAGIDEAGRGPLAGPVMAAAVILPAKGLPPGLAGSIDDSKALTARRREAALPEILSHCAVGIGTASVGEIDRINILQATFLSMRRALAALPNAPAIALVDGNRVPKDLPCPGRAIVGGDRRSLSIAAASIVAKVTRDRLMAELSERHPGYGWERNAGYGTREHLAALRDLGVTPHHRRSFAPVSKRLSLSR
jgi:ribonuclease HII